jgi:hypothetical protein
MFPPVFNKPSHKSCQKFLCGRKFAGYRGIRPRVGGIRDIGDRRV